MKKFLEELEKKYIELNLEIKSIENIIKKAKGDIKQLNSPADVKRIQNQFGNLEDFKDRIFYLDGTESDLKVDIIKRNASIPQYLIEELTVAPSELIFIYLSSIVVQIKHHNKFIIDN